MTDNFLVKQGGSLGFHVHNLKTIVRQSDKQFISVLMEIREGPNTKGVQKMTPLTRGRTLPASMCDVTQHEVIRQNELVAPEKNRKSTSHLDVDVVDLT